MRCARCRSGAAPDKAWCALLWIVSIALVLVCAAPRPVVAEGGSSSFFGYLFWLFFADQIPEPPPLTLADRDAIAKMEVLLLEQNVDRRTGANYLLLGILAGARGDEDVAADYLRRAAALLPDSSLPAIVAGQVRVQARDFEGSLVWHGRAQEMILRKPGASPFLAANSHMDLAVVYAKLDRREEARAELGRASEQLARPMRQDSQAALAWLQMGTIYATVLEDAEAARGAWQAGREVLAQPELGVEALVRVDIDVRIADTYTAEENHQRADAFLQSALQVLDRVPADIRPLFQLRVGTGYARLADQQPEIERYAALGLSQVNPLLERRPVDPGGLQIYRTAALVSAGLQQRTDPERARVLTSDAVRATLEIGLEIAERDLEWPAFQLRSEDLLDRQRALELVLPPIEGRQFEFAVPP